MRILGIDPGLSGACAFIEDGKLIKAIDMPVMPVGSKGKKNQVSASVLAQIIQAEMPHVVIIERVSAMPGQGVSSMFNFGMSYGAVIGIVAALGIRIEYVTPQAWKKYFKLIGAEKDLARTRVMELYPEHAALFSRKKDCGRADATLIARYFYEE